MWRFSWNRNISIVMQSTHLKLSLCEWSPSDQGNKEKVSQMDDKIFLCTYCTNHKGFDASPCRDDLAHGKPDRPSREQVYGEPDMPYPVPAPYLSPAQGEPAGPCLERVYGEPVCDKPSPVPAPCPTPAQGDPDRPCLEQVYGHPELLPMPQPQTDPVQTSLSAGLWVSLPAPTLGPLRKGIESENKKRCSRSHWVQVEIHEVEGGDRALWPPRYLRKVSHSEYLNEVDQNTMDTKATHS